MVGHAKKYKRSKCKKCKKTVLASSYVFGRKELYELLLEAEKAGVLTDDWRIKWERTEKEIKQHEIAELIREADRLGFEVKEKNPRAAQGKED